MQEPKRSACSTCADFFGKHYRVGLKWFSDGIYSKCFAREDTSATVQLQRGKVGGHTSRPDTL